MQFGDYQTVRQISRSATGVLYLATATGNGQRDYAIRLCQPPALVLGEARAQAILDDFRARAKLQQRLAQQDPGHWAPIHDIGDCDDGVYVVTDYYPASAAQLILQKVSLSSAALAALSTQVLDALIHSGQAEPASAGVSSANAPPLPPRSHSHLTAAHILITDPPPPPGRCAHIALTDPAASPPGSLATGQTQDLRDLGEILYELVLHKPFHTGVLPLKPEPAWLRLGPTGNAWREFVNDLLAEKGTAPLTLDQARTRLGDIQNQSHRRRTRNITAVSAVVALVLAAIIATVLLNLGGGRRHITPTIKGAYRQLIQINPGGTESWFGQFLTDVNDPRNHLQQWTRYQQADLPGLDKMVKTVLDAQKQHYFDFDPHYSDYVRNDASASDGLVILRRVTTRLSTWKLSPQFIAGEALLRDQLKCSKVADYVASLPDQLRPTHAPHTASLSRGIDHVLAAGEHLRSITTAWAAIRDDLNHVQHTLTSLPKPATLPLAAQLHAALAAADFPATAAGLASLDQKLTVMGDYLHQIARYVAAQCAKLDLAALPATTSIKVTNLTFADFRNDWSSSLGQYVKLDADPLGDPQTWTGQVATAKADLAKLSRYKAPAAARAAADFAARLQTIQKDHAALAQLLRIKKNRQTLVTGHGKLTSDLAALIHDQQSKIAAITHKWTAWLQAERTTALDAPDSPALAKLWQTYRDRELATLTGVATDHTDRYIAAEKRLDRLKARLLSLAKRFPATPTPPTTPTTTSPTWRTAIDNAYQTARGQRLAQLTTIITQSTAADQMPDLSSAQVENAHTAFETWRNEVAALIKQTIAATNLLKVPDIAPGHPGVPGETVQPRQKGPNSGAPFAALAAAGKQIAVAPAYLADVAFRQAVKPVLVRIDQVAAATQSTDPAALWKIASAATGDTALALAVWQRLGTLNHPATVTELDSERAAEKSLIARLSAINAGTPGDISQRATAWQHTIQTAAPSRWQTAFANLRSATDIQAAVGMMDAFHVQIANLPARLQLNARLAHLRADLKAIPTTDKPTPADTARLATRVRQFITSARQLKLSDAKDQATLSTFITALDNAATPTPADGGKPNLSKAGPVSKQVAKALSWKVDSSANSDGNKSAGGRFLTFTWTPHPRARRKITYTLHFIRVHPEGDAEATYVCTTEVSVGLFKAVVDASNKWSDIGHDLTGWLGGVPADGPATWRWVNDEGTEKGKFQIPFMPRTLPGTPQLTGDKWFDIDPTAWLVLHDNGLTFYPANLTDLAKNPPAPRTDDPMQQLSPKAAKAFAKLIGCRLPTVSQWQAAYQQWINAHPHWDQGNTLPVNLRDATWQKQAEHIVKLDQTLDSLVQKEKILEATSTMIKLHIRPNAGIFALAGQAAPAMAQAAADYIPKTDGTIWFAPVTSGNASGKQFHDLIGNVAELVESSTGLAVIGGSALWPPSLLKHRYNHPYPIPTGQRNRGFSDVGMRLAFTAPNLSMHLRVELALSAPFSGQAYLP